MRRILLVLLLLCPMATHAEIQVGDLTIRDGWSRAAVAGGQGAGYLTIQNRGALPDRLIAAASPAARALELHTHLREGDVLRMRAVPDIEIPAGATVTLQPGGLHLMLLGLAGPLQQGGSVAVTLTFARAGTVQAVLSIQAAGARSLHAH